MIFGEMFLHTIKTHKLKIKYCSAASVGRLHHVRWLQVTLLRITTLEWIEDLVNGLRASPLVLSRVAAHAKPLVTESARVVLFLQVNSLQVSLSCRRAFEDGAAEATHPLAGFYLSEAVLNRQLLTLETYKHANYLRDHKPDIFRT